MTIFNTLQLSDLMRSTPADGVDYTVILHKGQDYKVFCHITSREGRKFDGIELSIAEDKPFYRATFNKESIGSLTSAIKHVEIELNRLHKL